MQYSTRNNEAVVELTTKINERRKWQHYHRARLIGVTVIVLALSAMNLSLLLEFVIFAPTKMETTTILTTSPLPVTTTSPQTTAISTSASTVPMTTNQQSGKL
jgi:hypothetical protein